MSVTCESCVFFQNDERYTNGDCRVRAPVVVSAPRQPTVGDPNPYPTVDTVWPKPDRGDWCGDHKPEEATK